MTSLRTILVDDEDAARELLRSLLRAWPEVEIVGEAATGMEAFEMIVRDRPNLVFLDVQMPGMTGLEVASALSARDAVPLIVFVTAYDRYAVQAFEVSACDYLLKPFDEVRLNATMRRVKQRAGQSDADILSALRLLVAGTRAPANEPLVVKVDGRHLFLNPNDVEWIEAVGKEVRIHSVGAPLLVRETMSGIEGRLDPVGFVRVHRSAIVNRIHIREIQPWFKGDCVIILKRGARVITGRTYRQAVHALLQSAKRSGADV